MKKKKRPERINENGEGTDRGEKKKELRKRGSCPLGSSRRESARARERRAASVQRDKKKHAARGQKSGGELLGQLVEKSGEIRCCLGSTWRRLGNEGLREEGCCAVLRTVKQLER
ncbi:hypothetical protein COP1_013619 [Malus domestica]